MYSPFACFSRIIAAALSFAAACSAPDIVLFLAAAPAAFWFFSRAFSLWLPLVMIVVVEGVLTRELVN